MTRIEMFCLQQCGGVTFRWCRVRIVHLRAAGLLARPGVIIKIGNPSDESCAGWLSSVTARGVATPRADPG